jgi:hypothetical protein
VSPEIRVGVLDGKVGRLAEQFIEPRTYSRVHVGSRRADGAEPVTFAQLYNTLLDLDRGMLAQVFHNRAAQLPIDMPRYFWVANGRTAVFSIPALSDEAQEHGFSTSDHALIQALLEIDVRLRCKVGEASTRRIAGDTA